ncbi:Na+/H+ antiporter subunit E [Marinobacter nanhaiticus D15-8W]|uniref:Na+/H+ antiporter subunit E n=1 Tax=Marinobacter nanhaiticus D15-8W TaxID=626887 RepID=N6WNN5_9GAMM|nr:Na+/H+ antiporter subunit E [Marinobacter nanhaiticus]ENO13131.1 Na+/H+ antiporter subunit E [Marinobacter nanhaiticus D15-8W]BES70488.1 Na+/H+ antiporter subunit E [Marinobacter nanhaiticus D15-8W]
MNSRFGLPHPVLSITLFLVWQALNNGISGASVVMGLLLAWLLPLFTRNFWPDNPHVHRPLRFMLYVIRVIWDIIVASINVALIVINPKRRPKPAFVSFPLELKHPLAISTLAGTISLTPGTVSADISDDQTLLLIHVLDVGDEMELIETIKRNYERPLGEIFK